MFSKIILKSLFYSGFLSVQTNGNSLDTKSSILAKTSVSHALLFLPCLVGGGASLAIIVPAGGTKARSKGPVLYCKQFASLYSVCVCVCECVCFLPIHSGHQVRWTYQPGSHRRKVTQDFSSTFFLCRRTLGSERHRYAIAW